MANPTANNPGVISDPRSRALANYWASVQTDLNNQTRDVGLNIPGNMAIYRERFKPLPASLFVGGMPNPNLRGFSAGRRPFGGYIGSI